MTGVITPPGLNADALRKLIHERFDMSLGTGLGKLKGRMFRIGHLGNSNDLTLLACVAGCEMGLKLMQIPVRASGVQAAMEYFALTSRWHRRNNMKRLLRPTNVFLVVLALMYFLTYLDRVNVSTAAAGFGKDFDLSKTQIGLVFSAFAYPYLFIQIVGGWISDRFGARRTLIACGLIWAAATALTGLAAGLASMIVARVLLGIGEGATFPAATCAMSRWVVKEERGFAQGFTHAAARIGNAAAPPVVVAIMATYGWRASFFVCAAVELRVGGIVGGDLYRVSEGSSASEHAGTEQSAAAPQRRDRRPCPGRA